MVKLLKQDIGQWRTMLLDAVWFVGEHAFTTTVVLILLAGGVAALLFYQYVLFSPQGAEEAVVSEFAFQKETFVELLERLDEEQGRVEGADALQIRDLFNP